MVIEMPHYVIKKTRLQLLFFILLSRPYEILYRVKIITQLAYYYQDYIIQNGVYYIIVTSW